MIGSLEEFLHTPQDLFSEQAPLQNQESFEHNKVPRPKGKTYYQSYVPVDKTHLLKLYQKNNLFNNRKKYHSIVKETLTKSTSRKPLCEHKSFFVKPEVARDYIAKEELKRKHNLLRAILRMRQTEEQPKTTSDYEQSFQRLYEGFSSIHPKPVIESIKYYQSEEKDLKSQRSAQLKHQKPKSGISNKKRIEFEHCLNWAKKHNKNGEYFAVQLGKSQAASQEQNMAIFNRSLIKEIEKKLDLNTSLPH